jgi:hypothetical protein
MVPGPIPIGIQRSTMAIFLVIPVRTNDHGRYQGKLRDPSYPLASDTG